MKTTSVFDKVINCLSQKKEKLIEKQLIMRQRRKQECINFINNPMSDGDIIIYNLNYSAHYFDGNYYQHFDEKEIKLRFLSENKYLFSSEEYIIYYNKIMCAANRKTR